MSEWLAEMLSIRNGWVRLKPMTGASCNLAALPGRARTPLHLKRKRAPYSSVGSWIDKRWDAEATTQRYQEMK